MENRNLACLSIGMLFLVQGSIPAQDFPPAQKILDRYVKETGGIDAYKNVKTAKMSGTMSVPAAGIDGKMNIQFKAPQKFYFKAEIGAIGVQERGSNGKVVWENSTLQGARLIKGEEAEQMIEGITFANIISPQKIYKSMKTTGTAKVGGEECYELELVRKSGTTEKEYYSVKTGLKLKSIKTLTSPLGEIQVETYESDYEKSKNGLVTSRKQVQKVGPQEVIIFMSKVEFNVDVEQEKFKLPPPVADLVD